ncbi:MAG: winged helix-turn-helix domain-containing protein [Chloroflexi bacterium]|nr:winged helix-turn-helix domain-containing protein [Chloroflexota bacterium]
MRRQEYELLLFFARHRGQAVGRETILEWVWGWTYEGGSRRVDVHVRWLRERIENDPSRPAGLTPWGAAGRSRRRAAGRVADCPLAGVHDASGIADGPQPGLGLVGGVRVGLARTIPVALTPTIRAAGAVRITGPAGRIEDVAPRPRRLAPVRRFPGPGRGLRVVLD